MSVIYVDFTPSAPPPELGLENPGWPRAVGKTAAASRPIPARLSARPVRVLRRRFRRSQFAQDLRQWGFLIGLLTAGVVLMAAGDHLHQSLTHLFGGIS